MSAACLIPPSSGMTASGTRIQPIRSPGQPILLNVPR